MQNPLQYLPVRVRAYGYFVLGLLFAGFTAYLTADGDWVQAVILLAGTLGFATAKTHTPKPPRT